MLQLTKSNVISDHFVIIKSLARPGLSALHCPSLSLLIRCYPRVSAPGTEARVLTAWLPILSAMPRALLPLSLLILYKIMLHLR